jgi:DNA-binding IclR family transcriptional regulator
MTAVRLESNKVKIAKRVIEVFEFLGGGDRPATVVDIARHYGRPQSSTSELLSSLVAMGLLYKDPVSREFTPTPRLAALGISAQPALIRDGRLFNYMDQLARMTRKTVALFGMVGPHAQVFRWISAPNPLADNVGCGSSEPLSNSIAGILLLSTFPPEQARGMLWRLNAEAPVEKKFDHAEMVERVARLRRLKQASGEAGFVPGAQMSAVLVPRGGNERPLVLGVLYPLDAAPEDDTLLDTLKHGVSQVVSGQAGEVSGNGTPFLRAV